LALGWMVSPMHAIAVLLSRLKAFDIDMPNGSGFFSKWDPLFLLQAVMFEKAKFYRIGIGSVKRKVNAFSIPCGTEGKGRSRGIIVHFTS
jgi:hypothetical protein